MKAYALWLGVLARNKIRNKVKQNGHLHSKWKAHRGETKIIITSWKYIDLYMASVDYEQNT